MAEQHVAAVRSRLVVLLVLAGCGPQVGGASASADAGGTTTADSGGASAEGSTSSASATTGAATSASDGDTSTGSTPACVDNIANPPWCYRRFPLDGTSQRGLFGRMGPAAEPRFFFPPSPTQPAALIGWDGQAIIVEPQAYPPDLVGVFHVAAPRVGDRDDVLSRNIPQGSQALELWLFPSSAQGFETLPPTLFEDGNGEPYGSADVDGDGLDEVIAHWRDGGVLMLAVLDWDGARFTSPTDLLDYNLAGCGGPVGVEGTDLDGDAFEDLVIATDCGNDVHDPDVYLIHGAPTVAQMEAQIEVVPNTAPAFELRVVDLDGDGDDDIVLPYGDFFLTILVAQARGVFGPPIQIWDDDTPLAVDGDPGWTWDFGDLDGDGATEILAGRTAILNSTTTPAFAEYLPKGAIDPITIFVAAGDVSGDGIDDFTMLTQPNQIEILVSGPQLD